VLELGVRACLTSLSHWRKDSSQYSCVNIVLLYRGRAGSISTRQDSGHHRSRQSFRRTRRAVQLPANCICSRSVCYVPLSPRPRSFCAPEVRLYVMWRVSTVYRTRADIKTTDVTASACITLHTFNTNARLKALLTPRQ